MNQFFLECGTKEIWVNNKYQNIKSLFDNTIIFVNERITDTARTGNRTQNF